jgi:L-aminopeptidase/D-esterase-like protein
MKGGIGTAAMRLPGGGTVAALEAVNAFGDVIDPDTGRPLAGVRSEDGQELVGAMSVLLEGKGADAEQKGENTSIGVIATDVTLTQAEATKVAQMAHDGLARVIRPVHTPWDGDTLFAVSTGGVAVSQPALLVGAVAAEVTARAVLRGVRTATGVPGIPSISDLESA